ncbi:MAG: STAS domain-containing protein [Lachnospiraceae bacterium]|nr:STAS domain-containing protein [Lachnospiraceae bacterium]
MEIKIEKVGKSLTVKLKGRLDTSTSPKLENELKTALHDIERLIFDLSDLEYISSAGLRVLLAAQKTMHKLGDMVVLGANKDILEIFDVTGFSAVLNIIR